MTASHPLLARLVALANPDGGWGYAAGTASHPEPTCLALLALSGEREAFASQFAAGLAALERHHQPDGSYRLAGSRPEAGWPTAVALFTRLALGTTPDVLKPTVERILAVESRAVTRDPEITDMQTDIDLSLVGWPWAATNFGWVEPTAWSCLALRAAGLENHSRVQQGITLLLDRAFDSGGGELRQPRRTRHFDRTDSWPDRGAVARSARGRSITRVSMPPSVTCECTR